MRQLLACLRRLHLPRMHRGSRATICLRCLPCLTCGSAGRAGVGWCAAEHLS